MKSSDRRNIKNVAIIANPISGMGKASRLLPALQRELGSLGIDSDILLTQAVGDGISLARAAAEGHDAVVAVGGDGTINEVINGVAQRGVPFAAFPTGTANVLAKEFRLPRDPREFARVLAQGNITPLDTGVVGNRRFALFAGIGLDASIVRVLSQVRTSTISMFHYVWPTVRVLWEFASPELTVHVDDRLLTKHGSYCLIANVRSYGGPFEIASKADPTDGLLDVCVTTGHRRRDMIRYFWAGFIARMVERDDVITARGQQIVVSAQREASFQVDGDCAGTLPATFTVQAGALPLICPG